jgi:hypothetical protein
MLPPPLPKNTSAFRHLMNGSSQCFSLDIKVVINFREDFRVKDRRSTTPGSSEGFASCLRRCSSVTDLSVACSADTKDLKEDQVEEYRRVPLSGDFFRRRWTLSPSSGGFNISRFVIGGEHSSITPGS